MFKVTRWTNNDNWSVTDENKNYMHTDGSVYYRCGEYWPTREQAQAVLDKYQPAHVWEHGDVFDHNGTPMIYFVRYQQGPSACCLSGPIGNFAFDVVTMLKNVTFLFNIKDKLPC